MPGTARHDDMLFWVCFAYILCGVFVAAYSLGKQGTPGTSVREVFRYLPRGDGDEVPEDALASLQRVFA